MMTKKSWSLNTPACSFEHSFLVLLENNSFHDVTLVGNDGIKVTANRCSLSVRCDYFQKMFMGKFQESSSNNSNSNNISQEIHISNFSGSVIKSIVQYLHTSKMELLETLPSRNSKKLTPETRLECVETLVSLASAAAYFQLPSLLVLLTKKIQSCIKDSPILALPLLHATPLPLELEQLALSVIRSNAIYCLTAPAVTDLPAFAVTQILTEIKAKNRMDSSIISISHLQVFDFISLWASSSEDHSSNTALQETAKQLVSDHVDLTQIGPDVLCNKVEVSGLADRDQLYDAYKAHALASNHETNNTNNTSLQWKKSQSEEVHQERASGWTTDVVDCPPMTAGTYQWSLTLEQAEAVMVGVVSSDAPIRYDSDFSVQKGTWASYDFNMSGSNIQLLYANGVRKQQKQQQLPTISGNSTVQVTLNLDPTDADNGSLSFSVDGRRPVVILRQLREHLNNNEGGFLPGVSISGRGGRVRIHDLQQL
ncbi:expressed unknown protein [Seminavis robusta]|uniref:BTB domain-containing protein n=1 Tax=Seminavis robusta TaxID=568900 RepID=A0A9N8DEU6_9STRA|nr:expressed unknown protein [Seminavis robusta]|eukprot:Sro115_g056860.1 n/a (482) ;mRNA; f:90092-91537